jgi:ArsR family transcriptional regulator
MLSSRHYWITEVRMSIDFSKGSQLLKAISDPTRICIVHILSCHEMCVCDLQDYFKLAQPTLSHHLGLLKSAGIVTSRNKGKWAYYTINRETVKFLTGFLDAVFLPGDECLCHKIVKDKTKAGTTCP